MKSPRTPSHFHSFYVEQRIHLISKKYYLFIQNLLQNLIRDDKLNIQADHY
jgi:hypothetical protein